jgi:hypothetical protein
MQISIFLRRVEEVLKEKFELIQQKINLTSPIIKDKHTKTKITDFEIIKLISKGKLII